MSQWTWEFLPDADAVVAGLPPEVVKEVEEIATELSVVNSMVYLDGPDFQDAGPGLRSVSRPDLMVFYITDVRGEAIYVVRVHHYG
ncbi:hypothetical protein ACFZB9_15520 [Kitasatospora sp. NPDC008050]|uniref:hypothetical protein n=1 Tax=Kitasatospora sp. NPDC008050 TaxID=3364021 RepID=UPI0036E8216D